MYMHETELSCAAQVILIGMLRIRRGVMTMTEGLGAQRSAVADIPSRMRIRIRVVNARGYA